MSSRGRGVCRFFSSSGQCRYGASCRFLHEGVPGISSDDSSAAETQPNARRPPGNELEAKFRTWRFSAPKSHLRHYTTPLPPLFFHDALTFVNSEIGLMQETIVCLAGEGGLLRMKQLVERNLDNVGPSQREKFVEQQALPMCQTITHPHVLASTVLDVHIGTIFNFIYGGQGQRAVGFFKSLFATIANQEQPISSISGVTAAISAFSRVIDCNTHSLINEDFKPIADVLFDVVATYGDAEAHEARKLLHRIARRLALGRELPSWNPTKPELPVKAIFKLQQDLPGHISKDGPRHDNDHFDACDIQIMPTYEEVHATRPEYLPSMNQDEWHEPGITGLLDRQFRLLREDTVGQLRDAVRQELHSSDDNHITHRNQGTRRLTYDNGQIVKVSFNRWQGLLFTIQCDQPVHLRARSRKQRQEWWEGHRRLCSAALICLLSSQGALLFCSVVEPRKPEKHSQAHLEPMSSSTDDDPKTQSEQTYDLWTSPSHAYFTVSPTATAMEEAVKMMTTFTASPLKVVEFPGVLLPSFEPTLHALQTILKATEMPFSDYLCPDGYKDLSEVEPPYYATKPGFQFDLRCIMQDDQPMTIAVNDATNHVAFKENSILDETQADALLNSLNRSLALIQGPPGTGKSFTGVALLKVLLAVQSQASLGPILCVCFTNHALDQLLEDLVHNGVDQVVRMGSRSKSEILQNCNLRVLAQNMDLTQTEKREYWNAKSCLEEDDKDILKLIRRFSRRDEVSALKAYLEIYFLHAYSSFFGGGIDEDGFQTVVYDEGNLLKSWVKGGSKKGDARPLEVLLEAPVELMIHAERQQLYSHWLSESNKIAEAQLLISLTSYSTHKERFDLVRGSVDLRCLQQAKIIGITTTGLARMLPLLRKLDLKVLLCEEAGEILEAHVLTALLPSVEHLVLIGDHKQLPPKCGYDLSRESAGGKRYSLDVSLFERLVTPSIGKETAVPYSTLETQRRMYPSISALIRNTLYPSLSDSPVVSTYPSVAGMARRLFWFDHAQLEDSSSSEADGSTSHSNAFEVEMVKHLVSHLIRQGVYGSQDVAVLTPYLGQLQQIRRALEGSFEISLTDGDILELEKQQAGVYDSTSVPRLHKKPLSKSLRVSTIDNFQGEEAKVVLISLVRSNEENKCGFLRTSSRINVLLSRAKHGMYIIGNSSTSGHVAMWASVIQQLKADGNFGRTLGIQCARHDRTFEVANPDDFSILAPEGGCDLSCEWRLACGHACTSKCHSQMLHGAVNVVDAIKLTFLDVSNPALDLWRDASTSVPTAAANHVQNSAARRYTVCTLSFRVDMPGKHCHATKPEIPPKLSAMIKSLAWCLAVSTVSISHAAEMSKAQHTAAQLLAAKHLVVATIARRNAETADEEQKMAKWLKTTELVKANVVVLTRHAVIAVLASAMTEVTVPHVKHHAKCRAIILDARDAVTSLVYPVQKRNALQIVLIAVVPCHVQHHATGSLARSVAASYWIVGIRWCPTICGEPCPSQKYCQVCGADDIKNQVVDLIMMEQYHELDLTSNPCIIPPCGHIMTRETMDGQMEMSKHYQFEGDHIIDIKDPAIPFSQVKVEVCSNCRGPLRSISRYGRIIRRGLIDEATKKFIVLANQQYMPFFESIHECQSELTKSSRDAKASNTKRETQPVIFSGTVQNQLHTVLEESSFVNPKRYDNVLEIYRRVDRYLQSVAVEEQPFQRIWDTVQFARRRGKTSGDVTMVPDIIQTGQALRGRSLLLRCELVILSDFLAIHGSGLADVNLEHNREACLALCAAAKEANRPLEEAEAYLYLIKLCIAESMFCNRGGAAEELSEQARDYLATTQAMCATNPGSTERIATELKDTEAMVKSSSFTTVVRHHEWRAVMAAMQVEFRGSGHWYTCVNGHPFTVGECGMPMQLARCPACGEAVGGQSHQPAAGVQHAYDLEARFRGMNL